MMWNLRQDQLQINLGSSVVERWEKKLMRADVDDSEGFGVALRYISPQACSQNLRLVVITNHCEELLLLQIYSFLILHQVIISYSEWLEFTQTGLHYFPEPKYTLIDCITHLCSITHCTELRDFPLHILTKLRRLTNYMVLMSQKV